MDFSVMLQCGKKRKSDVLEDTAQPLPKVWSADNRAGLFSSGMGFLSYKKVLVSPMTPLGQYGEHLWPLRPFVSGLTTYRVDQFVGKQQVSIQRTSYTLYPNAPIPSATCPEKKVGRITQRREPYERQKSALCFREWAETILKPSYGKLIFAAQ
eukprot:6176269-Karenia_brevis.AAC.1